MRPYFDESLLLFFHADTREHIRNILFFYEFREFFRSFFSIKHHFDIEIRKFFSKKFVEFSLDLHFSFLEIIFRYLDTIVIDHEDFLLFSSGILYEIVRESTS